MAELVQGVRIRVGSDGTQTITVNGDPWRSDKVLHPGPAFPPDAPVATVAAAGAVFPVELTRTPTPTVPTKRALAVPPPIAWEDEPEPVVVRKAPRF